MKSCNNIVLLAVLTALWLQKVSAASSNIPFSSDIDSISNNDERRHSNNRRNGNNNSKKNVHWGSHDIQTNNVYSVNVNGKIIFGPQDTLVGNHFPANPRGRNVYGPILEQKNNTYDIRGGGNIQFGPSLTLVDNVFPKNPGKNDIYAPVVIQEGNTYSVNPGENNVFGAIGEHINKTYSKSVEANKDALKPIQSRNVSLPTPGINGVVGSVVKRYGKRFHQDHYNRPGHHLSIDTVKRQHENLNRRIHQHLQTYHSTSRRCTYGMKDLKRLDHIEDLYLRVETPVADLKELQEINRYRKLICDSIGNQCSNNAKLQKWIASSRREVMDSTTQSRERLESLQSC